MSESDFCYWLQGFFELNGEIPGDFTDDQRRCIVKHLDLVDYSNGRPSKICCWIRGAVAVGGSPGHVAAKLAEHFKHVIDPATPGDQGQMNAIHGDTLMRC